MRSNFIEILKQRVEIPMIQRDYAQGRTDSKTTKIRKDFLDALFDFIHKKSVDPSVEIELDFIYGFHEGPEGHASEFIPIDGQQRLTTLWLLYWFIASKEEVSEDEKAFLVNFVYEIRHSTTQFCNELIKFSPDFTNSNISSEIKNQSWYFETWDFDPSIQAMLVVLADIEKRYNEIGLTHTWQIIGNNSCPFYFYKLDMKKVGLSDDLYIKMNSRGKPLTEFEYFKAGFTELIHDIDQRNRFSRSIDGVWMDTIWQIVNETGTLSDEDDIAFRVDLAFLNLFNFITSVISYRKDIKTSEGKRYLDTVNSADLLSSIYSDPANQDFLFDTLDAICKKHNDDNSFWTNAFYFGKTGFNTLKTRLFFQHNEPNLLKRCLSSFSDHRGLSLPEQLLLLGCFTEFKYPQVEFANRIRIIRNLVANSDNELRESVMGSSFDEIENYILNGDLNVFRSFKTDQINEEIQKEIFLSDSPQEKQILQQLEDSEILRGSISLFPLDENFGVRATRFLELFDEDDFINQFVQKSNLLLCFGDYSQDSGSLTNMMAGSKVVLRDFLTTPGYNKNQFTSKTRTVLMDCLDYFNANPATRTDQKITETISSANPKDWKYYFIKYDSFRENCHLGYYRRNAEQYCIWKMGRKQFNGYHWDPFLHEVFRSLQTSKLELDNYGAKLLINCETDKIWISTASSGFQFQAFHGTVPNPILTSLKDSGKLNEFGILEIPQDNDGFDLEDRIEKLKAIIEEINMLTA